jgi:hypothetical protein
MGQVVVLDFTPELQTSRQSSLYSVLSATVTAREVYLGRASPSVTIDWAISRSFEISANGLVRAGEVLSQPQTSPHQFDYDSPAAQGRP